MKIIFGYIRVSGKGQVDKDGPVRQRESILKFCEEHKFDKPFFYSDLGVSGTVDGLNRPGLTDLLSEAEACRQRGDEVAVVVENMDRFARDLIVSEVLMKELRLRNVALYATNQGFVDQTTADSDPTRKLIRQLFGALAEWEKSMIVIKLRIARDRKRRETGRCEGGRAFGVDGPATSGNSERTILNLIQRLRHEKVSWFNIANWFNANEVKKRNGQTQNWRGSQVCQLWRRHEKRLRKIERIKNEHMLEKYGDQRLTQEPSSRDGSGPASERVRGSDT